MSGGLTPVGQPLDKVINKVFKGHFRDLYDHYTLTAPMNNGSTKAPTRQLFATWVVQAWDMNPADLVRRSWTACGYPNEDEITGANEGAVVAYTGEQVESLVERLYRGNGPDGDERGAEVRSDFMDEACVGEDPHFPSDDKCSSDEELDDDEEVDDIPNAPEARLTAGPLRIN